MVVSKSSPLIFERSRESRYAYSLPQSDIKTDSVEDILDEKFIRKNKAEFPEVAELD
ncbi:aminomethyl-transferring glycine dehydrogenase subunit GcvPB, partial [Streptococcus equi]|nr:aminomethyl-transferring glycine dehydrogenase subunit GcvPB [Streptococcus equi]